MRISVMVFEVVFVNYGKQGNDNSQDGSGMKEKSDTPIFYPAFSCINIFSPVCSPVAVRTHQRGDERSNDNEMAEITDKIVEHPAKVLNLCVQFLFLVFRRTLEKNFVGNKQISPIASDDNNFFRAGKIWRHRFVIIDFLFPFLLIQQ